MNEFEIHYILLKDSIQNTIHSHSQDIVYCCQNNTDLEHDHCKSIFIENDFKHPEELKINTCDLKKLSRNTQNTVVKDSESIPLKDNKSILLKDNEDILLKDSDKVIKSIFESINTISSE